MFGVASRAVRFVRESRMQSVPVRQLRRDLGVTLLALQLRGALAHHVAACTLRRSPKRFMGARKWPRRNLPVDETR